MSLTRTSPRHGIPGGPDGRPRPCPVGPWRRPGGHYHLLLAQRHSANFLEGHWKGVFFWQDNPSGQGANRWGSQLSDDTWTKMWDRGSTVHPPDTHTVSKNKATVPLRSWRANAAEKDRGVRAQCIICGHNLLYTPTPPPGTAFLC